MTAAGLTVSRIPRSTPLGRRAGLVGLGLLAAGFNTGNNLFYLFFTILAASELVGFLVAGHALRRAGVDVILPPGGRQGAPLRATVRVANRSRWLPLPRLAFHLRSVRGDAVQVETPSAPPGATVTGVGRLVPSARGWLDLGDVEVRTDFPLGLSQRRARLTVSTRRTLVLPSPLPGTSGRAAGRAGELRAGPRPRGAGDDPGDARAYRHGDDARRMDWKASARTDQLIWRPRRGEPAATRAIRLDRSGLPGPAFEQRVARAAGALAAALARGEAVAFESDECRITPRDGRVPRRRILEYLALVRAAGERPLP